MYLRYVYENKAKKNKKNTKNYGSNHLLSDMYYSTTENWKSYFVVIIWKIVPANLTVL